MSTANLDERNLALAAVGGTIHEDVMDKIWDISPVDLPFQDSIGRDTSDNHYKEWVEETLEAASPDNKRIDGSDSTGNDTQVGARKGNYHQISTKIVRVSDRGRNVNSIGTSNQMNWQIMQRQKALRRDVEARLCSNLPAVAGGVDGSNNATSESECAGIGAFIATNSDRGATGTDPTLSGTTGGFPDAGPGAGTIRALSEATVRDIMRQCFMEGGNPTMMMSSPSVIEKFSSYLFTSSARIAALQTNVPQGNRTTASSGNGKSGGGVVAQGSVNVFVTDFGTLELVPNRFQPVSSAGAYDVFLIDPDYWSLSFLQGYETKPLARTGLSENREISVDYTLCAMAENSSGVIADIDETAAAVA